jgi:hypothetical protein
MNLRRIWFRFLLCSLFSVTFRCSKLDAETTETRARAVDSRAELAAQVERNIEAGGRMMAAAREQAKDLDDEARAEFTAIAKVARSAETRLRRSLKSVETASADNWPLACDALAANYEAYVQAIAQAERLVTADRTTLRHSPHPR